MPEKRVHINNLKYMVGREYVQMKRICSHERNMFT